MVVVVQPTLKFAPPFGLGGIAAGVGPTVGQGPVEPFDLPVGRIWCQIVALASELQAWSGMLALAGHEARRWEPKRLRYRLYTIPATLARRARRVVVHLTEQSRLFNLEVGVSATRQSTG